MGRKSRHKQQRRRAATFSVLSPGMLEVLSIGKGDLKIEIGNSNADRAKAQSLIEEMLRKGYTLFVETADGPLKVRKFLPDEMVYVVADTPDIVPPDREEQTLEHMRRWQAGEETHPGEEQETAGEPPPEPQPKPRASRTRKVPVPGSKTTAIGRTAGG